MREALKSDVEWREGMEARFPRDRYPYDCSACGARCGRVWDTVIGGLTRRFCGKGCLEAFLMGRPV
jgi:hypothetical protein